MLGGKSFSTSGRNASGPDHRTRLSRDAVPPLTMGSEGKGRTFSYRSVRDSGSTAKSPPATREARPLAPGFGEYLGVPLGMAELFEGTGDLLHSDRPRDHRLYVQPAFRNVV